VDWLARLDEAEKKKKARPTLHNTKERVAESSSEKAKNFQNAQGYATDKRGQKGAERDPEISTEAIERAGEFGLCASWSYEFGYVSIHDPTSGEWHDLPTKDAPGWAIGEAKRRKALRRSGDYNAYRYNSREMGEHWRSEASLPDMWTPGPLPGRKAGLVYDDEALGEDGFAGDELVALDVRTERAELALTYGHAPRAALARLRAGEGSLDDVTREVMAYFARSGDDYRPWRRGVEAAIQRLEAESAPVALPELRVVNIKHEPCDVYIGRENRFRKLKRSAWHNPFKEGVHGSREEAIEKFEKHAREQGPQFIESLRQKVMRHGGRLGCWCAPADCHG